MNATKTFALNDILSLTLDVEVREELGIQITGLTTGTLQLQVSNDGTVFTAIPVTDVVAATSNVSITANGVYRVSLSGFKFAQLKCTALTAGTPVGSVQSHRQ